jgi:hypothetical protein
MFQLRSDAGYFALVLFGRWAIAELADGAGAIAR